MSKRLENYDNLKGFLIYLVVLGHLLLSFTMPMSTKASDIVFFIFSFHMPLFMMISGYFSKKDTSKSSLIRLILLFLILNLSYTIYDYIDTGIFNLLVLKHSSWYLILLVIYKALYNLKLRELVKKYKFFSLIIPFLLAILIGFLPCDLFICRFFEYLLFFNVGYLLNYFKLPKDKKIYYLGAFISFLALFILVLKRPQDIYFYLGSSYTKNIQFVYRTFIFLVDIFLYISLINIVPNKRIPVINYWGKTSLYIYVLHRIPTLLITNYYIEKPHFIKYMFLYSIILTIILSCKYIVLAIDKVLDFIVNNILNKTVITVTSLMLIFVLLLLFDLQTNRHIDIMPKTMSNSLQARVDNSLSIGFLGDLILLEDQVNDSKTEDGYNFDYMFKYMKRYIQDTDFTIGVFEGPSDDNVEYSYGNYDDGKELHLNYPTQFIESIKNAGIDLVTTSNNHIYDRGYDSAIETMNNLEKYKLDYVGSYTKDNMSGKSKIIDVQGVKIGVVAYTFYTNYQNETENDDVVERLCEPENVGYFEILKQQVEEDIKYLKDNDVDLVIVLPHYGTEFNFSFTPYQLKWNDVFINAGADIIFGDHSHVIGPIKYYKDKFALASPGNYVNSYIGKDSDLSMYVKVYIDRKTKKIITSSVIPLLAIKEDKGYLPASLYDLDKMNVATKRVKKSQKIFNKVVLNDTDAKLKEEYYVEKYTYKYPNKDRMSLVEKDKDSLVYKEINKNKNICFIGDSITEGTKNDYHPWYEALMNNFPDKFVQNISGGGYTTYTVLEKLGDKIKDAECELALINIGTNDIRYNAEDPKDYLNNMKKIIKLFDKKSTIILIAPWKTYSGDMYLTGDVEYKKSLYSKYNDKLKSLAQNNKYIYFINPNEYIAKTIQKNGQENYLIDGVHPNNNVGIKLYSYAALRS